MVRRFEDARMHIAQVPRNEESDDLTPAIGKHLISTGPALQDEKAGLRDLTFSE
jgi:hypothetical protein